MDKQFAAELMSVFGGSSLSNNYFLNLQMEIQADAIKYSAISNIMKAKYDTQKNAIGNMR